VKGQPYTGTVRIVAGALAAFCLPLTIQAQKEDSRLCAGCHREIWASYPQTAMGRSFYRPSPDRMVEDFTGRHTYYHQPSDSYFTMLQRGGQYYQRRHQLDPAAREINVVEQRIDYVLGSGNHARAYLHRNADNTLIELPLAWYAEKGGYWGMNPGYDRPNHDGFRRQIGYECMFCHNAYPEIPAGHEREFSQPVYQGVLPEGIDCQRCHGSGSRHMQLAASAGATRKEIRDAVVNPARLSANRQIETCMVCHLETTSFPLPNAIQRYDRGPFSYRAGEPMGDFILSFDHAPGTGHDGKFEIVNAAYRLRRSACFLKSNGGLGCTTCHNPHRKLRGESAERHYSAICRECHAAALDRQIATGRHSPASGCVDCHMPKRRTEDVVHVVVTDHLIQRRKPEGDLLAERAERHETAADAYHGRVVLYYPETLPQTPENELYLAVAQVKQGSNLKEGIARLATALAKYNPALPEFYLELADALDRNGQLSNALPWYREAVRRSPDFAPALQRFGTALRRSGQHIESAETLERAVAAAPGVASAWHELGLTYRQLGKTAETVAALRRAIDLDPELPEAHNNLGIVRLGSREGGNAESEFREAIRIRPDYADAHGNLANLLSASGKLEDAAYHFGIALRLRPNDAPTRYNYALLLGRARRFDEAQQELEASLRADPGFVDAHERLGDLLVARGQPSAAVLHYREALRLNPDSSHALLGLGTALVAAGDVIGAVPHLQRAASAPDALTREKAAELLRQLGRLL
jgi:tetratricopeptide (TPR) repeat protein